MNIHCFVLVYNKNKSTTHYTLKGLRWAAAKLRSYDRVKVTIVDDARHPGFPDEKSQEELKGIGADDYVQTTFPRRGNMRGRECLIGLLKLFNSTSYKTDWVIQYDNDMFLKTFEHLRIEGGDVTGVREDYVPENEHDLPELRTRAFTYGAGTAIRRKLLPKMLAAAETHPIITSSLYSFATDCYYGYVASHVGGLVSVHAPECQSYHVTPEYRYYAAYMSTYPSSIAALREAYMINTNCHMWEGYTIETAMRTLAYRALGFDLDLSSLSILKADGAVYRRKWGPWTLVKEWWARCKHRRYLRHVAKHAII